MCADLTVAEVAAVRRTWDAWRRAVTLTRWTDQVVEPTRDLRRARSTTRAASTGRPVADPTSSRLEALIARFEPRLRRDLASFDGCE
jgi:hypothetical protein